MSTVDADTGSFTDCLGALHEAQERDGRITRQVLEELAARLHIPVAQLFQAASFYHYFDLGERQPLARGVCRGPVCSLTGIGSVADEAIPSIPCPGLCDSPVAVYEQGTFLPSPGGQGGFSLPYPVDTEQALFRSWTAWRSTEGMEATSSLSGWWTAGQWTQLWPRCKTAG